MFAPGNLADKLSSAVLHTLNFWLTRFGGIQVIVNYSHPSFGGIQVIVELQSSKFWRDYKLSWNYSHPSF